MTRAYYKFTCTENELTPISKACSEWERELNKSDSYCFFLEHSKSDCYYSCNEKDLDDIVFLQKTESIGYNEISKEDFISNVLNKKNALITGSRKYFTLCQR